MTAITPLGDKIRSFRAARGYTQLQLALAAGISERTVRTAEKGVPLRQEFLEFIAGVFGAPWEEFAEQQALVGGQRWEDRVALLTTEVRRSMDQLVPSRLLDVVHREFAMKFQGGFPGVPAVDRISGDYRGRDGVKRLVEDVRAFWALCPHTRVVTEPHTGGGDVIIFRCHLELPHQDGSLVWGDCSFICEFDGDLLMRLDIFLAPADALPKVASASLACFSGL